MRWIEITDAFIRMLGSLAFMGLCGWTLGFCVRGGWRYCKKCKSFKEGLEDE